MEDFSFVCNIPSCRKQIIEKAWVTRCLHVFCLEHGQLHFAVPSNQISCPVCDTVNSKEVDVVCCETNPHEMLLSGVSPERALHLATVSVKMWSRQIYRERNYCINRLNSTTKKLQQLHTDSQKHYVDSKSKLQHNIAMVQKAYNELIQKYNKTKRELEMTKIKLQKYQLSHNSAFDQADDVFCELAQHSSFEPRHIPSPYFIAPSDDLDRGYHFSQPHSF